MSQSSLHSNAWLERGFIVDGRALLQKYRCMKHASYSHVHAVYVRRHRLDITGGMTAPDTFLQMI